MASSAPFDIGTLITSTPGVQGGQPCLAGTRFPVSAVAAFVRRGPGGLEALLDSFPHLDIAKVHAAVAYYHANKDQFEERFSEDAELIEKLRAEGW